jgi:hypothetical protein
VVVSMPQGFKPACSLSTAKDAESMMEEEGDEAVGSHRRSSDVVIDFN